MADDKGFGALVRGTVLTFAFVCLWGSIIAVAVGVALKVMRWAWT